MTEALRKLSELMQQMDWATTEITAIKDDLADLHYDCEGRDGNLSARIDLCEFELSELRSVTDDKTESPNQKSDLEIFSRIEPSTEFLILGDIGWSEEIMNIGTHNMFLN